MKFDFLHKRPHYEELIDTISFKQPKIKYPNRVATFIRNSPYLSQFDGDSWIDLEEQENNILKEKLIQEALRKVASDKGITNLVLQGTRPGYATPSEKSSFPPSDYDDQYAYYDSGLSDLAESADEEIQKKRIT